MQLESNIAARDWFDIPSVDLLWCADRARRLDKPGPTTNKDMLEVYRELKADRGAKRRKIENQRLFADPKEPRVTQKEIREIFKDYLPKMRS